MGYEFSDPETSITVENISGLRVLRYMSNKEDSILVGGDNAEWQPLADVDVEGGEAQCVHCEDTATKVVECNTRAYWAMCRECAHQSHCESMEAAHKSESEMDYYAGYE